MKLLSAGVKRDIFDYAAAGDFEMKEPRTHLGSDQLSSCKWLTACCDLLRASTTSVRITLQVTIGHERDFEKKGAKTHGI